MLFDFSFHGYCVCLFQFWDAASGVLKCVYGESEVGVTGVNFVSKK